LNTFGYRSGLLGRVETISCNFKFWSLIYSLICTVTRLRFYMPNDLKRWFRYIVLFRVWTGYAKSAWIWCYSFSCSWCFSWSCSAEEIVLWFIIYFFPYECQTITDHPISSSSSLMFYYSSVLLETDWIILLFSCTRFFVQLVGFGQFILLSFLSVFFVEFYTQSLQ